MGGLECILVPLMVLFFVLRAIGGRANDDVMAALANNDLTSANESMNRSWGILLLGSIVVAVFLLVMFSGVTVVRP